jgi:integrase
MPTIRRLRNRWQAMVRRKAIAPQCKSFEKRAEAALWARALEAEADRIGPITGSRFALRMTLAELLSRYAHQVSPNKRSAQSEKIRIAAIARRPISSQELGKLTSADIAAYRDARLKQVSPATVVRELNIIGHAIEIAIREWDIPLPRNPVKLVRKPPVQNSRKRRFHHDEQQRLLSACDLSRPPEMKQLIVLAVETAMRRGELLSLEWQDIDLNKRVAHVKLSKNGESRDVPLSKAAVAALHGLPRSPTSTDRIFALTPNQVRLAFERVRTRAGLADIHFHDLRHEAISRLFERGLSISEVGAISGHKELRMLNRYTHFHATQLVRRLDLSESKS